MSATARSRPRPSARAVVWHFAVTRGVEVGVLQASPLLGAYLGGPELGGDGAARLFLLLLGSIALTAHVFVFNDWAGYRSDAHDLRRANLGDDGNDISRERIARLAVALLIAANVAFAFVGLGAVLCGVGIAALSLMYSSSRRFGKSRPVAASLNHLTGGTLHFLLGYSMEGAVDVKGVCLGLFFGLVFAAGHLNQEVRDHESDRASGIATSAVVFGPRWAFLASFGLFSAAYALIVALAAFGVVAPLLLLSTAAWVLQAGWSLQALRRGLGFETALWMQRRYRLVLAVVGVALLVD
jgi:4-hydroxybenzoate polyprenyltransferase